MISRPRMWIRPDVGLVMQPMRLRRVVLPEPLGPLITVIRSDSITRLVFVKSHKLVRPSRAEHLPGLVERDHPSPFMTVSGSMMAALQDGMIVATV